MSYHHKYKKYKKKYIQSKKQLANANNDDSVELYITGPILQLNYTETKPKYDIYQLKQYFPYIITTPILESSPPRTTIYAPKNKVDHIIQQLQSDNYRVVIISHDSSTILTGGQKNNSNTYSAKVVFPLGSETKPIKEILIGEINFSLNDNPGKDFDNILEKINKVLKDHYLKQITDFHYMQEDGDIAYANKELVEDNQIDLFDAIKNGTLFYVYHEN